MGEERAFQSASRLVDDLASGAVSSRELLELHLDRVARFSELNAVVTVDAEGARKAADAADAARAAGAPCGPLHGLPMTVKDVFETAGMLSTGGAPELAHHVPDRDAIAVERLRSAGAVLFGKTNTPVWAGDWQTTNPIFGRTRNACDPERTPGGSSGGSAAALAAGLTPLELGSDIGGSIRVPSHWSGTCGHKPTWGIVPQRGHLPGPPGALAEVDLNVVGPMARTVEDLELALSVLCGPTPEEAPGWRLELPPPRATSLEGLRVGVWIDDPRFAPDPRVAECLRGALGRLAEAGAPVREVRLEVDFEDAVSTYMDLLMPLNTRTMSDPEWEAMRDAAARLPDDGSLALGGLHAHTLSHRDWLRADEDRLRVKRAWLALFDDVDVVVCPVNQVPAIRHDDRDVLERQVRIGGEAHPYLELIAWPAIVTMAGLPATAIPMGRVPEEGVSLPVGAQIVGAPYADRTTLAFARAALDELGGFRPEPAYAAAQPGS
ncbi:MAG: amidase [Myxococcota bacterium]|nr:amidase [Myxococcota bacterium]